MNQLIFNKYREWLTNPAFDQATVSELRSLSDDEIRDRFYCDLEFGTSGVRGILGAGTNRMNIYLVRCLSWSLGQTILAADLADSGVVISYDSRRCSAEFALETALVLGALGIKVFLFDALRPTPELSFAVRYLHAAAGVMITASHNPKEYNGYKIYGADGAQITPDIAENITQFLQSADWEIPRVPKSFALENGLLTYIGDVVDTEYRACVLAEMLKPSLTHTRGKELQIVYTPLHGCGRIPVEKTLAAMGFSRVATVPAQAEPDTEFSATCNLNPEDAGAWDLSLELAVSLNADILIATDPDSDRLGIQCRLHDGSYYLFTGNQIGILLTDYILRNSIIPSDGVLVQNAVSTAFTSKLATYFGVEQRIVPVGFKFIGEQIKEMEDSGHGTFLFGFEESIGYLKGTYTRDKDAVCAAALVAEAALYYKVVHKKTLHDVLMDLFAQFGYYLDKQVSLTLEGREGKNRIDTIMNALPALCRDSLAGLKISNCEMQGKLFSLTFENGGFIKARPSGTEPKIRFYFCVTGDSEQQASATLTQMKQELFNMIDCV